MDNIEAFIIDTYRYWCYESSKPIEVTNETKALLCRKEWFVYGVGMTTVYFANGMPVKLIQGKVLNQFILLNTYKNEITPFFIKTSSHKHFMLNDYIASENP